MQIKDGQYTKTIYTMVRLLILFYVGRQLGTHIKCTI